MSNNTIEAPPAKVADSQAVDFLRAVHGDTPGSLCIWTSPDKASRFFANTPEGRRSACSYAAQKAKTAEVYFGLALQARPAASGRGGAADAVSIGCLWMDIDFGAGGHAKKRAPDEETARRLLGCAALAPSIIVHSGGGLHAYWLLDKPWLLADSADRAEAGSLVKGWETRLQAVFKAEGYEIDAVADLARILRLPGTVHRKDPSNLRPVRILEPAVLNGELARYAREAFAPQAQAVGTQAQAVGTQPQAVANDVANDIANDIANEIANEIAVAPADLPIARLEVLLCSTPNFQASWDRQRKDFGDQSASQYDVSLGTMAAAAGWTDAEIVRLWCDSRTRFGDDTAKPLRPDYQRTTLGFIHSAVRKETAADADPLGELSKQLGIPVSAVYQVGESDSTYDLVLSDGRRITLGSTTQLRAGTQPQARLTEACHRLFNLSRKAWGDACVNIVKASIVLPAGGASDDLFTSLESFADRFGSCVFGENKPLRALDLQYGLDAFTLDGRFHLRLAAFVRDLIMLGGQKVDSANVRRGLARLGFEQCQLSRREGDVVKKLRTWRGPEGLFA